ncbi:hypothetical protein [Maribellus maritimus]|uniref:hypothetical protein n=1 Tax=Maribellus maritimus TaxID=2870838 RepID=UPI001EECF034|nr:hypothetical protein [Maribellus maritimus]MCG6189982.1 hypothetical protein [Maribellus maritimus]
MHFLRILLILRFTLLREAHGLTDYYGFNYDVKNHKMISVGDIIEQSSPERINRFLKSHFKNPEDCYNTAPTLDWVTTINFTTSDVCFTDAQHKLGPYVCRTPEVTVPLPELKGMFLLARKN